MDQLRSHVNYLERYIRNKILFCDILNHWSLSKSKNMKQRENGIKSNVCTVINNIFIKYQWKSKQKPGNIFKWYELLQNTSVPKNVLVKTREELCNFFISPNNFIHLLYTRSKGYFAANSISPSNNSFIPVGTRYISPFYLYTIQKKPSTCLLNISKSRYSTNSFIFPKIIFRFSQITYIK